MTELAGFIPGKNLAYYDGYEASHVASAHELLAATIEAEEIPFDGVVGYSQVSLSIFSQAECPVKGKCIAIIGGYRTRDVSMLTAT